MSDICENCGTDPVELDRLIMDYDQTIADLRARCEKAEKRYRWVTDWIIRGGARSEIDPMGHIQRTSIEILDERIDASIAKERTS